MAKESFVRDLAVSGSPANRRAALVHTVDTVAALGEAMAALRSSLETARKTIAELNNRLAVLEDDTARKKRRSEIG